MKNMERIKKGWKDMFERLEGEGWKILLEFLGWSYAINHKESKGLEVVAGILAADLIVRYATGCGIEHYVGALYENIKDGIEKLVKTYK